MVPGQDIDKQIYKTINKLNFTFVFVLLKDFSFVFVLPKIVEFVFLLLITKDFDTFDFGLSIHLKSLSRKWWNKDN